MTDVAMRPRISPEKSFGMGAFYSQSASGGGMYIMNTVTVCFSLGEV